MALTAAALVPTVSTADPFRPSIKDQIELGKRGAETVREEERVLPSTDPRVRELKRLGDKLLAQIPAKEKEEKPFEYSFNVIDNEEINAFALPGGPIFFYSGLLDRLDTEDQVIGILGHELAHVRNQHWASAYADNTKRRLGISVVLMLLGAGSTAFDVAGVADTLLFTLPYSRKHESEADEVGYSMMTKAGYNPQGLVDVFKILKQNSGGAPEEWLSTHPDSDRRINDLQNRIQDDSRSFPAQRPRRVQTYSESLAQTMLQKAAA